MQDVNLENFLELAKEHNLIPLMEEMVADTETPISLFLKLKDRKPVFLLESAKGSEKNARYSFIGLDPFLTFTSRDKKCEVRSGSEVYNSTKDPFEVIQSLLSSYKTPTLGPLPFYGGAVGYMGYEMVQFIENVGSFKDDNLDVPDCCLAFCRIILIYNHRNHTLTVVNNVLLAEYESPEEAFYAGEKALKEVVRQIKETIVPSAGNWPLDSMETKKEAGFSSFSKAKFCSEILKTKDHIFKGDIFQGVLSRRMSFPYSADPFKVYRILRSINPSPYMFYLDFANVQLAGASPEMLVRLEKDQVTTRPIAGTRPRGKTPEEDNILEHDLIADPKERAEHLMLVDLGRNDLGKVCNFGSIQVKEIFKVDRFSHVMHMVSEVEGSLKKGFKALDVFKASFPAGTVTGAPKIRAMEIINKAEPVRRGPYAGAVGYFSFSGNMDTCITIRTMVFAKGEAHIQAGAGIVAESQPLREYMETKEKARALIKVLAILQEGEEKKCCW